MNPIDRFYAYVQSLPWQRGQLDKASHNTFLRAASLEIDPQAALNVVEEQIQAAGGHVRARKLERQLRNACQYVGATGGQAPRDWQSRCQRPVFQPGKLARMASKIPETLDDEYLAARSKFTCWNRSPAGFLHKLYLPGEKVVVFNVFRSQGCEIWQHPGPVGDLSTLDYLQEGWEGVWFLANPVDGKYHWNPREEKYSRRSEESITAWRYAVAESDDAPRDQWMRLIVQIPLPISAIYESGKNVPHVLFRVDAKSKKEWDRVVHDQLLPGLVSHGACEGSLTAVRLTRLPNCWREETGRLQKLLYLDDAPDLTPICRKEVR